MKISCYHSPNRLKSPITWGVAFVRWGGAFFNEDSVDISPHPKYARLVRNTVSAPTPHTHAS